MKLICTFLLIILGFLNCNSQDNLPINLLDSIEHIDIDLFNNSKSFDSFKKRINDSKYQTDYSNIFLRISNQIFKPYENKWIYGRDSSILRITMERGNFLSSYRFFIIKSNFPKFDILVLQVGDDEFCLMTISKDFKIIDFIQIAEYARTWADFNGHTELDLIVKSKITDKFLIDKYLIDTVNDKIMHTICEKYSLESDGHFKKIR